MQNSWQSKFEECYYSKRLLDKITHLNSTKKTSIVNITKIKKAIYYAKKYHGAQLRQSGEPFYSHPLEVAYMISEYSLKTDILIAAILHDTIEDTTLTKEVIAREFSSLIANQVDDLTRIREMKKISTKEMLYSLYKQEKYDVLLIKLFDRLHNIQTIHAKPPDKAKIIIEETTAEFIILASYLELPKVKYKLMKLLSRKLPSFSELCNPYVIVHNSQKTSYYLSPIPQYDKLRKQILELWE